MGSDVRCVILADPVVAVGSLREPRGCIGIFFFLSTEKR